MGTPTRLTVVMTHPIQYYSPWFRFIASDVPELDLTVLYASEPSPSQQGAQFEAERVGGFIVADISRSDDARYVPKNRKRREDGRADHRLTETDFDRHVFTGDGLNNGSIDRRSRYDRGRDVVKR